MPSTTAQEAFATWAINFAVVGSGLLLAICIAVTLVAFAANRNKHSSRHDRAAASQSIRPAGAHQQD